MPQKHSCDIIAIASDEAPYIADFVHHYLYLGFSDIYIGLNNNSDSTQLILEKISNYYTQLKIINVDEFQAQGLQSKSYEKLWNIAKCNSTSSYCLLVDVDEFWLAPAFPTKIYDFIQQNEPFDVFSFHWVNCFGGNEFSPPLAGDYSAVLDPHVKSIIAYSAKVEQFRCHAPILTTADHSPPICRNSHMGNYTLKTASNQHELPEWIDCTHMLKNTASGLGVIMHRYQRSEVEYAFRLLKPTAAQSNATPFKDNRWGYNRYIEQGIAPPYKLFTKEELDVLLPSDSIRAYHKSLDNFINQCGIGSMVLNSKLKITHDNIVQKIDEVSTVDLMKFKDIWRQTFQGTRYLQVLRQAGIRRGYYQTDASSRKIDVLFIGHDAFNAGSQRALLWLIAELRLQQPELTLGLLLLDEGLLIHNYKAQCPLSVISLDDIQQGDHDLLVDVLPKPGATVIANSVMSLPALLALRSLLGDNFCRWGLWIHELPDTVVDQELINRLQQATNILNTIITPSPLAEDLWKRNLMGDRPVDSMQFHNPNWLVLPPKDTGYKESTTNNQLIKPRWPDGSSCRLLGFGRDQESFERFRSTLRDLKRIIPDAGALWVGPVGAEEAGLVWMPFVDVTLALQQASLFLLTTGGSAKCGESFGLIAAQSLMIGCPIISIGTSPLGVANWWPKELQSDLSLLNRAELLERIQKVYEGGKQEGLRRYLLAKPYIEKLEQDRKLSIKQLIQIIFQNQ